MGMKKLQIEDPVKARLELHMQVQNAKFPTKELMAAHAAIMFLDTSKNWDAT